ADQLPPPHPMPGHARADFDDSLKPFASHRSALRCVRWRSVWHARRLIAGLAIGAALLPLPVIAAADGPGTLLPVEDFARPPEFTQLKLSPDGHYVAFLR